MKFSVRIQKTPHAYYRNEKKNHLEMKKKWKSTHISQKFLWRISHILQEWSSPSFAVHSLWMRKQHFSAKEDWYVYDMNWIVDLGIAGCSQFINGDDDGGGVSILPFCSGSGLLLCFGWDDDYDDDKMIIKTPKNNFPACVWFDIYLGRLRTGNKLTR